MLQRHQPAPRVMTTLSTRCLTHVLTTKMSVLVFLSDIAWQRKSCGLKGYILLLDDSRSSCSYIISKLLFNSAALSGATNLAGIAHEAGSMSSLVRNNQLSNFTVFHGHWNEWRSTFDEFSLERKRLRQQALWRSLHRYPQVTYAPKSSAKQTRGSHYARALRSYLVTNTLSSNQVREGHSLATAANQVPSLFPENCLLLRSYILTTFTSYRLFKQPVFQIDLTRTERSCSFFNQYSQSPRQLVRIEGITAR